jgi:ribosome-binding factor A
VTITRVDLSRDGSHAKVGFSCLGGAAERERSQEALDHAAGFVRGQLARRLRLKIIPVLVFRFDEGIGYAIDMEAKLDQLARGDAAHQRIDE